MSLKAWIIVEVVDPVHKKRNIVHHDIKPENILIDKADTAKLTDFGISLKIGESGSDQIANSEWGTKQYLPPECWKSNFVFRRKRQDIRKTY